MPNKKFDAEKLLRLQNALRNKPNQAYLQAQGLDRADLRKIQRIAIERGLRKPLPRPTKIERIIKDDMASLLEVPVVSWKNTIEYPTPNWFRQTEPVDVSVIIPLYKSEVVIEDLIHSWDITDGLKVECIFVDDHCPHDSKNFVLRCWSRRKDRPVGRIFYNNENLGFGVSCNAGAEKATGRFLVFLNADTVVTPGWIKPIVDLLENPEIGVVGNLQLKKGGMWDGCIDGAGSEWLWESNCFMHIGRHSYNGRVIPKPFTPLEAPKDILQVAEREMVTGCCFGIRKDLFREIGGFNPNYRIGYWEDSELCMTVREKGYKVYFQPGSVIYHKLGHSNASAHKYQDHNRQYFLNKWVNSGRIDSLVKDRRRQSKSCRTILLRRSGATGDVLLAAAMAPALQQKFDCKVLFSTDCPDVLKGNPYIARVVPKDKISERLFNVYYDLDLAYEYRPFTHILEAYADVVGVSTENCKLFLATEPIETPDKYVVVHAGKTGGSAWVGRQWLPDRFRDISQRFLEMGKKVVSIGSEADYNIPCTLDLRGKTTIQQLAHVVRGAEIFVGIDSFPLHVCQAFNVPGVAFFGAVDPKTRLIRDNITPVQTPLPCLGCHHRQQTPCTVTCKCETGGQPCVFGVTADQMWCEIQKCLASLPT